MPPRLKATLALAAFAAATTPAFSAAESFRADYSVTLLGLPVAQASFDSTFNGDSFTIEGTLRSSGIARLFDRTNGTTKVEGSIAGDGVQPSAFLADYVTGRKQSRTAIRYSGNAVSSVAVSPEPPERGSNWVGISQDHLRAALDPISSTLIRTSDPAQVCNRTIRAFDGELRADLRLSHHANLRNGQVRCNARFVPVAGYREGRRQIEFMKNESRIAITFAPLGNTGFYTPVDATVGTQVGPLRITANRIQAR